MKGIAITRGRALAVAGGLVLLLVLAGRYLVPAGTPAPAHPIPAAVVPKAPVAASEYVVHVVGAVRRPGLYRLTHGTRIADAVARAGGATRKADLSGINLAAPLADGEQVVVPKRGAAGAAPGAVGAPASGPVHLSTATLEQLDTLPGIGPTTAQKILDYRAEHGAFHSVDELDAVPGIGPTRLDELRDLVAP